MASTFWWFVSISAKNHQSQLTNSKINSNRNSCCTIQIRGFLQNKPYTIAIFQDFNCPILNSLLSNYPTVQRFYAYVHTSLYFILNQFILTFRAAFYYLSSTVSKRLLKWPYSEKRTVNSIRENRKVNRKFSQRHLLLSLHPLSLFRHQRW